MLPVICNLCKTSLETQADVDAHMRSHFQTLVPGQFPIPASLPPPPQDGGAGTRPRNQASTDGRTNPNQPRGSSDRATLAKDILGSLPTTIGTGEHEKSILEAVLQGMRDLSMDVQDLKGTTYLSWELEKDSECITQGMKYKEQYSEYCRKNKGKGIDLGHQRNYIFMGLLMSMNKDKDLDPEGKRQS